MKEGTPMKKPDPHDRFKALKKRVTDLERCQRTTLKLVGRLVKLALKNPARR